MNILTTSFLIFIFLTLLFIVIRSFDKHYNTAKPYVLLITVLSVVGIAGISLCRYLYTIRFNKKAVGRFFEDRYITWATQKFNTFFFISILVIFIFVLGVSTFFILWKNRKNIIWECSNYITVTFMILFFINCFLYSFRTINKEFDIALYIMSITMYELTLCLIPLVVKKLQR